MGRTLWGSQEIPVVKSRPEPEADAADYVDIFIRTARSRYPAGRNHDGADTAVRSGRALYYAGISNYRPPEARKALEILRQLGTPCLIPAQIPMFERWVEDGLLDLLEEFGWDAYLLPWHRDY